MKIDVTGFAKMLAGAVIRLSGVWLLLLVFFLFSQVSGQVSEKTEALAGPAVLSASAVLMVTLVAVSLVTNTRR